jgi:hypothetical protein
VIPEIADRHHELGDADSIRSLLATRDFGLPSPDVVIVNPRFRGRRSTAVPALLGRGGRMEIAARAEVALRPQRGAWRRGADFVEAASTRGQASMSLGVVRAGRYVVSVTGCRVDGGSVRIRHRTRTVPVRLSGPRRGCGRLRTIEPITLQGRISVEFLLPRDASIKTVRASPVEDVRRRPASSARPVMATAADTTSPDIHGVPSRGLTLADAFHPGWDISGSSDGHFRTILGFNGFVLDDPASVTGLSYRPQTTRVLVLALGALGWVLIALLWYGTGLKNRLRRSARWLFWGIRWLYYAPRNQKV